MKPRISDLRVWVLQVLEPVTDPAVRASGQLVLRVNRHLAEAISEAGRRSGFTVPDGSALDGTVFADGNREPGKDPLAWRLTVKVDPVLSMGWWELYDGSAVPIGGAIQGYQEDH